MRKAIEPDIAALASTEFEIIMSSLNLTDYLKQDLRPHALLNEFDITLVDRTPTPYTENLSPINFAYLKLCQDAQLVRYRQGTLKHIEQVDGGLIAHFEEGEPIRCDRVVTRFGVKHSEVNRKLLGEPAPRFHHGDNLLTSPKFSDGDAYTDIAREKIAAALAKRRKERNGKQAKWWAPKGIFLSARLLAPKKSELYQNESMILEERDLLEKLKVGLKVRYDDFPNRPL